MPIDEYVSHLVLRLIHNIWDAIKNPKHVGKFWHPHTAILIFMFWISYFLKFVYLNLKSKYYARESRYDGKEREKIEFTPLTHSWVFNYLILATVFFIDFRKRCDDERILAKSIIEFFLTVVPLYLACWLIFRVRFWRKSKKKMAKDLPIVGELVYGLMEGAVVYGFFNVAMNFRWKYKYSNCKDVVTGEREVKKFEKEEDERTKKIAHHIVFEGDHTWGDPTVVSYKTKTTIRKVQDP